MRAHSLASLSVLLLAAAANAAPHDHPAYPYDAAHAPNRTPPTWRRLSDAIIRRIWSLPAAQQSVRESSASTHHAPTEPFVARYGEDVVLRFTLRTAHEATALADAADTLFLDVWEFNEDWADIRVAKHVVSRRPLSMSSPPPSDESNARSPRSSACSRPPSGSRTSP